MSGLNIINLQVMAEDAVARDKANGTYAARIAADEKYYIWQGPEQTIPMGMDGDPEGFAAGLRRALPLVDTLRLPFNLASFNPDGSLHEQYERFLIAAAQQGFQIIFVQNEGLAQRSGWAAGETPDSLATLLDETVIPRMTTAWQTLATWLDQHDSVKQAVWGYELANEPAAWARGEVIAPRGTKQAELDRFLALYAQHMEQLAAATGAGPDDRILIGGWGYSGQFDQLARPAIGGTSVLDHLAAQFGDQLVWSAHLYPGWHGTDGLEPAAIIARLEQVFAAMQGRPMLLTEFNLSGANVNDTTNTGHIAYLFGRMQEWFADRGLGMGWFPGAEAGGSSLVTIDPGGQLRFLHEHSYAMAMNAFTLDDRPAGFSGANLLTATLIAGRLRNEPTDRDYDPAAPFDPVQGFGLAAGYGGNDTLIGRAQANNLLYGGAGKDVLIGAEAEDFLFGQAGNDLLFGGDHNDFLYGGRGRDTLFGGAGDDVLEGGEGADTFMIGTGSDIIVDFSRAQGDKIGFGTRYQSWDDIAARLTLVAHDGPQINDIRIQHDDGSATLILNAAGSFGAGDIILPGLAGVIDAPGGAIAPGYIDRDGEVFGPDLRAVNGHKGADQIIGTALADTLRGNAGNDRLEGRGGHDLLEGGAGNDTLFGGAGNDILHMGNGFDLAYGGAGNDTLHSGPQGDTLYGDAGKDLFVIRAGSTDHLLFGGAGADRFEFLSAKGGSTARIADFDLSEDRLFIDGTRVNLTKPGTGVTLIQTAEGTALHYADAGLIHLDGLFL